MIDIQQVEERDLNQGMLLLRHEFAKRGWTAQLAYLRSPHCFVDRGDGVPIHIFSTTPPTTSYAAAYLANDKYGTYELLRAANVRQLRSVVAGEKYDITDARALMNEVGSVVVKPIDGGHGKGITVGVTTNEMLDAAVVYGLSFTKSLTRVIVQEQYTHKDTYDIRISCIDGKFVAAILRVAARIYGDGVHTVKEIVENENNSSRRGEPYYAPLAMINEERAASYLGEKYTSVPAEGEEVKVLGIANYGAGGELVDVTDDIPLWMKEEAERVSVAAGLGVCGVDYMTAVLPSQEASAEQLDAVVIELNKCPSLAIHDAPTYGRPRGAVAAYVDYLATI